jgi:hypothetical protein
MSGYDLKVRAISGRGRGVIATREFRKGELIHVAPVILLAEYEIGATLNRYVFEWDGKHYALALGLASLFNHSKDANMVITLRPAKKEIAFWARKPVIPAASELTHDYSYLPDGYDGG